MTREELLTAYAAGKRDFSGAYLSGADLRGADLREADLYGAYLSGANLSGAYLSGADLYGANLRGANLYGANLSGAYLSGADLYGANLRGADLYGADLRGANLRGADLGAQWVVQGGTRSDGYQFMLTSFTGEGIRVKAGCRNFTISQAEAHWNSKRDHSDPLHRETYWLLRGLAETARARGYKV